MFSLTPRAAPGRSMEGDGARKYESTTWQRHSPSLALRCNFSKCSGDYFWVFVHSMLREPAAKTLLAGPSYKTYDATRTRLFNTEKACRKKNTHTHTQICIVFGIHTHTHIYIYYIHTHISTVQKDTSHSRRRSLTKSDIQTSGCKWLLLAFAWDFRQALDARLLTPTRSWCYAFSFLS